MIWCIEPGKVRARSIFNQLQYILSCVRISRKIVWHACITNAAVYNELIEWNLFILQLETTAGHRRICQTSYIRQGISVPAFSNKRASLLPDLFKYLLHGAKRLCSVHQLFRIHIAV
ncbi:hypothetical protein D3C74_413590 [compost metagenome]